MSAGNWCKWTQNRRRRRWWRRWWWWRDITVEVLWLQWFGEKMYGS